MLLRPLASCCCVCVNYRLVVSPDFLRPPPPRPSLLALLPFVNVSENGVEIPTTTAMGLGLGLEVMEGFSDHEYDGDGDGATSPIHSLAAMS